MKISKDTQYLGFAPCKRIAYSTFCCHYASKHRINTINAFGKFGIKNQSFEKQHETELAKLFETTYRAWLVVCFQEMHRISKYLGADFDNITDFLEDTHGVRLDIPITFPDVISGHCLIPNAILLSKIYDSRFTRLILKSNKKRKQELKDAAIKGEVEKVKARVEKLEKELTQP